MYVLRTLKRSHLFERQSTPHVCLQTKPNLGGFMRLFRPQIIASFYDIPPQKIQIVVDVAMVMLSPISFELKFIIGGKNTFGRIYLNQLKTFD